MNNLLGLAITTMSMIGTLSFAQEQSPIDWNKELAQHLEVFNSSSLAAPQDASKPNPVPVPVIKIAHTLEASSYYFYDKDAQKFFEVAIPGLKLSKDAGQNARFILIKTASEGKQFTTAMYIGFDSMLNMSSVNYVDEARFQRAKEDRFNDYPLLELKGKEVAVEQVVKALRRQISNSFSSVFPDSKHRISDSLLESARNIINGTNPFATDNDKKREVYEKLAQKTLRDNEKLISDLENVSERSYDSQNFKLPIQLIKTEIKLIKHLTELSVTE